jgi:Tfp pilus assembly protein PilO
LNKFNNLLNYLREYLYYLREDIKELRFNNIKEFLVKRKIIFVILLSSIFIITFKIYSYESSKDIVLKNLEIALKENKPEKIYKKVKVNNKKISKSDFQPLSDYYLDYPAKIDDLINKLDIYGESSFFSLKNEKRLFFDNYKVEINPIDIKINTNFNEAEIYVNNSKIESTKIKRSLIPGKYIIKAELNTSYGQVVEEQTVFAMQNEEYKLNLNAININLTSNFSDADVYINDINTNKTVKEIKNYGPIPIGKNIEIYLERKFPWGIIRSDKVKVDELPNINIDINMVNDTLTTDIAKFIKSFYDSVFNALNSNNYSLIENSSEETKNKIYDSIRKESLFLKNNYDITELNTEVKSSEYYYENNTYKANIVINLNYSISKKLMPFIKSNVDEMFLTQIQYVDEKWQVIDVQKFNLE